MSLFVQRFLYKNEEKNGKGYREKKKKENKEKKRKFMEKNLFP